MENKQINIIAFTIPYPPTYGGVIDVFYKIKALYEAGVEIYLHCFLYDREQNVELEKYCKKIYYYPRKKALFSAFGYKPYIVQSRKLKPLLENLLNNDYPILFEGLHTCGFLNHPSLDKRKKIVRPCNIEHLYYKGLGKDEKNIFKKIYFFIESIRLKHFEKQLQYAQYLLAISNLDTTHFQDVFPNTKVYYLPAFHAVSKVVCQKGKSDYILFHGDLSVSSNIEVVHYIVENIALNSPHRFVIAGRKPTLKLKKMLAKTKNIELIESPSTEEMDHWIRNAHIHLLLSFNLSGLKLKLLQSLFEGRFILCNSILVAGSGLESYCHLAQTPQEFKEKIEQLFLLEFDDKLVDERFLLFKGVFSNSNNANTLKNLL
ncbi:MAG: glycosyltransferase family 1 protein [Bacteroidales bacterium]